MASNKNSDCADAGKSKDDEKLAGDKDAEKENKEKFEFGLLEDDDEFEEFPAEECNPNNDDNKDLDVWEDNWDDDNVEDDFGVQLRAELEKQNLKPPVTLP